MVIEPIDEFRSCLMSGDLIIVVGSGVSVNATNNYPVASWHGLLEEGLRYSEAWAGADLTWLDIQRQRLTSRNIKDLLSVASAIEAKLGAPNGMRFQEFVRSSFRDLRPTNPGMLNGVRALHQAGALIATTNYDGLLEHALGMTAVPWTEGAKMLEVLMRRQQGVLHLHGWWNSPDSVVLGEVSYRRSTF